MMRAKKAMTKSQKMSSNELRSMEAKARVFLIKTINDIHILVLQNQTSAYGIFKTFAAGTKAPPSMDTRTTSSTSS